jgi:hypothetical protein
VPPQSASVSVPFFTVSVHVAARHFFVPGSQTALMQSSATAHVFVSAHLPHDPPQSTSVSFSFLMVSAHVAATHLPPVHTALVQSVAAAQALPSRHFVVQEPPQSTSVSVPFFVASVHVGAAGVGVVVVVGVGFGVVVVDDGVAVGLLVSVESLEQATIEGTATEQSKRMAPRVLLERRVNSLFIDECLPESSTLNTCGD